MDYHVIFPADGQPQDHKRPHAVWLDTGETFPIRDAAEEDGRALEFLPQDDSQADPEEDEDFEDDLIWDAEDEDEGEDFEDELVWSAEDVGTNKDDAAELDMSEDDILNELLEMFSRHEDVKDADFRRAQEEIRAELDRRTYHYIAGDIDGSPAFFIPSMGFLPAHFDLLIILKRSPNPCVRFKVTLPILCGSEMSPALLLLFAEIDQASRYFNWNHSPLDNEISLSCVIPLSASQPALPCMADLLDDALHIPLIFFPAVEWLSTGVVTVPVMPKQLKAMTKFLRQLEDDGPCLSPRALQRLRDGLAAVQP